MTRKTDVEVLKTVIYVLSQLAEGGVIGRDGYTYADQLVIDLNSGDAWFSVGHEKPAEN